MDHTRHSNIFFVPPYFKVGVIGAGGLGATTALALAKMGVCEMTLWDGDTVGEENIATQLHKWSDIGVPKVFALQRTLEEFSDEINLVSTPERIEETSVFQHLNLLISAVDSITARQAIWLAIKNGPSPSAYIDCRMSAEQYQHFALLLNDLKAVDNYENMLMNLSETDVPNEVCTMKSTFYTAMLAAGHVGTAFRNLLRGEMYSHRLVHYIPQNTLSVFNI